MWARPRASTLWIGCALVVLAASVSLLWVPWFPLRARAECGWTCYVPAVRGASPPEVLELASRGGRSAALAGTIVLIVAAVVALAIAVVRGRVPRWVTAAPIVLGVASLATSGIAVARILHQDLILVGPEPEGVKVGEAALGLGAVLALVIGASVIVLGLGILWNATRRPRTAAA